MYGWKNQRDRLRAMLADLKMPGALEAVDGILSEADSGAISPAEAIEQLAGCPDRAAQQPPAPDRHALLQAGAAVSFSLTDPTPQRLGRAAELRRDRTDRLSLRAIFALGARKPARQPGLEPPPD